MHLPSHRHGVALALHLEPLRVVDDPRLLRIGPLHLPPAGVSAAPDNRHRLAERELAEGMRQATKEFDRHVQPYLDAIAKSKGLTPEQARALVPPRLQQAIDQMRLAEQSLDAGGMAASEVESVINSLTCSKGLSRTPVGTETVAGDLSSFIKMLYKYGLKTQ